MFSNVYIDEGHVVKNRNTLAFKTVEALQGSKYFIITATPDSNAVIDYITYLDLIKPPTSGNISPRWVECITDVKTLRYIYERTLKLSDDDLELTRTERILDDDD